MKTQLRLVWLVTSRELRDQLRDWRILFPLVILTIFFPFLMNFTARVAVDFVNKYNANLIGERIIPFLLMVVGFFPVTVALVVALEAFVGEKERGTIEPLLSSPLADWHLYLGKLLASTIVPLVASYLGIVVYLSGLAFQNVPLPGGITLIQTLILTSFQAVLMVSGAMIISAQSTTVRAANLLASFIIIPVALLVQGESVLMFWGNATTLWLAVIGVAILSLLLVRVGLVHFQRENLLGREIDILNFAWMGQMFRQSFSGGAKNIVEWYRYEIPATVRKIRVSIWLLILISFVGAVIAFAYVDLQLAVVRNSVSSKDISQAMQQIDQNMKLPDGPEISFAGIFFNNVRASLAILIMGVVSFGVAGVIGYIVNIGLVGGILGLANAFNLPTWLVFVTGILPHGIFEIPAILLCSAVVLQLGVDLVTPNAQKTFGQVYIENIAAWLKIFLGLALPMLIIAALIESTITPMLIQKFLLVYLQGN